MKKIKAIGLSIVFMLVLPLHNISAEGIAGGTEYKVIDGFTFSRSFPCNICHDCDNGKVTVKVPKISPADKTVKPLNDKLEKLCTKEKANEYLNRYKIYVADYDYSIHDHFISVYYKGYTGNLHAQAFPFSTVYHYDTESGKLLDSEEYLNGLGVDIDTVKDFINGYQNKNGQDGNYVKQIKESKLFIKNDILYYEIFNDEWGSFFEQIGDLKSKSTPAPQTGKSTGMTKETSDTDPTEAVAPIAKNPGIPPAELIGVAAACVFAAVIFIIGYKRIRKPDET